MKVVDVSHVSLFQVLLDDAVARGLTAAAVVDRNGNTLDIAGAISEDEAMPLAALVMFRLKSDDLKTRLFSGEILTLDLDERSVALGVARRQLFVVAVMSKTTPELIEVVEELNARIASQLQSNSIIMPPSSGGGSGSSGPSELELIEYGITVPRAKA